MIKIHAISVHHLQMQYTCLTRTSYISRNLLLHFVSELTYDSKGAKTDNLKWHTNESNKVAYLHLSPDVDGLFCALVIATHNSSEEQIVSIIPSPWHNCRLLTYCIAQTRYRSSLMTKDDSFVWVCTSCWYRDETWNILEK